MSGINLNPKEVQLLACALSKVDAIPTIDFNEVAQLMGHKYARNTRASFIAVWNKLKASGENPDAAAGTDPATTTTPKKKGVGPSSTPKKTPVKRTPAKKAAKKVEAVITEEEVAAEDEGAPTTPEREIEGEKDVKMKDEDENEEQGEMGKGGDQDGKYGKGSPDELYI